MGLDTETSNADTVALAVLQKRARRSAFLLDASAELGASLEYEATLARVAELAIGAVADGCVIEIATSASSGGSAPVAIAHASSAQRELAAELWRRVPASGCGLLADLVPGLREGQPELIQPWSQAPLEGIAHDAEQLALLKRLDVASVIIAPILGKERPIGALTLMLATGDGRYDQEDLEMAADLARRVAAAIGNARLHLETLQALRAREDLLGIVAHDLRNPLSGMLMRCSLLLETLPQDGLGASVRRDAEAMRRSARRIEGLLRDLLDFAKIRAGRAPFERQALAVSDLLSEALEAVPPLAGKRTLEVDSQLVGAEMRLNCDRERFLQIFANLISNAIKFTKPDGTIAIACARVGTQLRVSITDNGPGIAADELPHVFQKHWQTRPRSGGAGLGLFLAKSSVEAQGGCIGIESAAGGGCTAWFSLPIAGEEGAPPTQNEILIVDDDAPFRRELSAVLAAAGYSVAEAGDGRQALEYLQSHPAPGLILLDLMMPVMDGWEFAAALKQEPTLAAIPIVAMSSQAREEASASLSGFPTYLQKPPHLEPLLALAARTRG